MSKLPLALAIGATIFTLASAPLVSADTNTVATPVAAAPMDADKPATDAADAKPAKAVKSHKKGKAAKSHKKGKKSKKHTTKKHKKGGKKGAKKPVDLPESK